MKCISHLPPPTMVQVKFRVLRRDRNLEIGRFLHLKSRNPEISDWTALAIGCARARRSSALSRQTRLKCESCGKDRLLPLSCKGRSVCPSCCGRSNQEMADTAAHLVDRVFS